MLLMITPIVATTIGCSSSPKQERVGEYIDDSTITTEVKAKLMDQLHLDATEVHVRTYRGVVELSGFVKSQDDITKAAKIARDIKGVSSVENDMHLR